MKIQSIASNFLSSIVLLVASSSFAQDRARYQLSSSDYPSVRCSLATPVKPSEVMAKVLGADMVSKVPVYTCSSSNAKYQVAMLGISYRNTALAVQNPGLSIDLKCSRSTPEGIYAYEGAPMGYKTKMSKPVVKFYNVRETGSCLIINEAAASIAGVKNKSMLVLTR